MPNPFRFNRILQESKKFSPMTLLNFLVHLPNFIRLFSRLLGDPRVPFHLKAFCYGSLIYLISPIDLIKDFLLIGIGYVDDIAIIILAFRKLVQDSPPDVVREHVEAISRGDRPPQA